MILVFAGAGTSKAVSDELYPTTAEFFQRLPTNVRDDALFQLVVAFLQAQEKDVTIDIEVVLWALEELRDTISTVIDKDRFPGWLLAGKRFRTVAGQATNAAAFLSSAEKVSGMTDRLWSRINEQVYAFYHPEPPREGLEETWIPLLDTLAKVGRPLEIFTTNYDVVLEKALEFVDLPLQSGRTGGTQPVLDTSLWQRRGARETGLLTKLHGSVDWSRGEGKVHVGTPLYQGSHERHVILYPGFKGSPESEPFLTFHEHLRTCLDQARVLIFIGFAFRDTAINQLIQQTHRDKQKVLVVNPERELPGLPYRGRDVQFLSEGLGKRAVDWINRHLSSQ